MKVFLCSVLLLLLNGCSVVEEDNVVMSQEDYYIVGFHNYNNYGMFMIGDDSQGLSYYDIESNAVISIPNKTIYDDSLLYPGVANGFTLYNDYLYYTISNGGSIFIYQMDKDGTNVKLLLEYENKEYDSTATGLTFIFTDNKMYFTLYLENAVAEGTEKYYQISCYDLNKDELLLGTIEPACVDLVGVEDDNIYYIYNDTFLYEWNIQSQESNLIYEGTYLREGYHGSFEYTENKLYFVENEKTVYQYDYLEKELIELFSSETPIEIRYVDGDYIFYTNVTLLSTFTDATFYEYGYYNVDTLENIADYRSGGVFFTPTGDNDDYFFGAIEGTGKQSIILKEDYYNGNFDKAILIEEYY